MSAGFRTSTPGLARRTAKPDKRDGPQNQRSVSRAVLRHDQLAGVEYVTSDKSILSDLDTRLGPTFERARHA